MVFHYLAAMACLIGALLQIAVHRAPEVVDSRRSVTQARRITIVALLAACMYVLAGQPPTAACVVLGLFGLGQMMYAAHNLKLDLRNGTHA